MIIHLVQKEKNKIYKSEDMVLALFGFKLSHTEKGAPFLEDSDFNISISDTKNYWACGLSENKLGIDMEEQSRKVVPSISSKLHKSEKEYLEILSFGSSEWTEEFLTIWTKKEAYSKYLGLGLGLGFSKFSVLEEYQDKLETKLYTQKYEKLYISATEEFTVEKAEYKAPMNKSALEAGADILDMFGCTAKTLEDKLLGRGYDASEAKAAVAILCERGYLNDDEYSRSISNKLLAKGYSSKRIEFELKQKGVSEELAKEYRLKFKDGDYQRAEELAAKLSKGQAPDDTLKAKIARKLSGLGYESSLVYDIIHKLK